MRKSDILEILDNLKVHSPLGLLVWLQVAMTIAFSTWVVLIQNFAYQEVGVDGAQYGLLQSFREIPGFLAFLVVYLILWMREQWIAYIALLMLAGAVALTGFFPSYWLLILTTVISSIGFHYYETINQSLKLQYFPKATAPHQIGLVIAAGSFATFVIYAVLTFLWLPLGFGFIGVYLSTGAIAAAMVAYAIWRYPIFKADHAQNPGIILRRRYWLYYLLEFLAGARRQIFVVFAGFMMVQHFGFTVPMIAGLSLVTFLLTTVISPAIGRMVQNIGEASTLKIEYLGLVLVFGGYVLIYVFDWPGYVAAALYILDHLFFAMRIALKTYFQKIGDAGDFASTAAVSFTINHIAAVFLPVMLGLVYVVSPALVFGLATLLAAASLAVSFLVPRYPSAGNETILARPVTAE